MSIGVKVYIEAPDEKVGFKHATCYLPEYKWEDIYEYTKDEINRFDEIIHATTSRIMSMTNANI